MLKIGRFYKTIETPHGIILGYQRDPTLPIELHKEIPDDPNSIIHIDSGLLALVVESNIWTSGDINDLFFKTIVGEDFVWFHPYDLVEVDEDGIPIASK